MRRSAVVRGERPGGLATVTSATPSIFISYRRDDSAGHAGRLADRLAQRLGPDRVFRDIEDIAAGEDFVTRLERQVDDCQVMLALIGPRWLAPGATGRPRLFDEQDWVRREIVRAMDRNLRVIPVLLQGASMPSADALPPDLARLARLNAMELREAQFDRDADYLVGVVAPAARIDGLRRHALAASLIAMAAGGAYAAYAVWDRTPERAKHHIEQQDLVFDDATFIARAAEGDVRTVRWFLRAGQDLEATDEETMTALGRAASHDHLDVVRLLLAAGARPGPALPIATRGAGDDAFQLLLRAAPDASSLNVALSTAAGLGSIDRMEALVAAGADVNADARVALRSAAFNAQPAALRWLIEHGGHVLEPLADDGETLLHVVAEASIPADAAGDPVTESAALLLDKGADPNALRGPAGGMMSTPLLSAASKGRPDLAALLLDHGAKPELPASTPAGNTPLIVAAEEDHPDVVALLLDRGARIDTPNRDGMTALMMAAWRRRLDPVNLLLERHAEVNRRDGQGQSALLLAVMNVDEKMVARLLEAGADANARTVDGQTALAWLESAGIAPDTDVGQRAAALGQLLVAHGARGEVAAR